MAVSTEDQSTILIIDDSVVAVRLLAEMLKDLAEIRFATNGADGLQLARNYHPQLILLDVEMPLMNGYEVCRQLKADAATSDISVIFVTAETNRDSEIRALQGGAVDFISKPLHHLVVRARVSAHLKIQRQAAALMRAATRDVLTGLYNRRYFDETMESEFLRHRRQGLSLGLVLVDIDYFKPYNDTFGHLGGDECLRKVATALADASQRPGEFVARFGGEEFVAVLPYANIGEASGYGEKICAAIRSLNLSHPASPQGGLVTISVGVTAHIPDEGDTARSFIEEADQALYRAKSSGRDRVVAWPII
ncbi:MAG TPA: diguanylate cyclase [Burkholderiaceae bacterium]|jgi:diguanylate cyclase (GGDEF)-like protein